MTTSTPSSTPLENEEDRVFTRRVTAAAIQLTILAAWVALSAHFIAPFFFPVLWGAILATAVWPLVTRVAPGRPKLGAILFLVTALSLILVPSWLLLDSIGRTLVGLGQRLAHGELKVPPPNPRVESWPLIGKRIFAAWTDAFETPSELADRLVPQIRPVGRWLMQSAGGLVSALLEGVIAVVLATVFLSTSERCERGLKEVAERLLPDRGAKLTELAGATVRSVAQGVVGVSLLQAMAASVGLFLAGVPAAGLLSLLVFAVAVMQLPPLLILLPATIYVFDARGATVGVVFLIWSILVNVSDGVLKPFLLGRGVSVPTLVILMGAIGGMIANGIIGLFVGAVVLAVSYELVLAWLRMTPRPS